MHVEAPLSGQRAPGRSLLGWLDEPREGAGVRFLDDRWQWRFVSYPELAARVRTVGRALEEGGLGGRRVAILAPDPEDFVVRFFAVLATGGTCVPLIPPMPSQDRARFRARLSYFVATARPDTVLLSEAFPEGPPEWPAHVLPSRWCRGEPGEVARGRDGIGLVQFSSGSTGRPKPIRVRWAALESNVAAIADWLGMRTTDRTCSWLPLYHDMGLIGCMLAPIATQTDLFHMSPFQFLRRPASWLRAFGEEGCTLTAAPSFGYAHVLRRVSAADLEGCDLSGWRVAIIGAEPVRSNLVDGFTRAFAGRGFRRRTFCPAYGLAEATLVVTATPPEQEPRVVGDEDQPDRLVSSGVPVAATTVTTRAADGSAVGDGEPGEIWVSGPGVAEGYEHDDADETFASGWLRTGDVGTIREGELYVFGRMTDSFRVRGVRVFAERAEQELQPILGQDASFVVVPSRAAGAGPTVVIESGRPWDPARVAEARAAVAARFDGAPVDLVFVPRNGIPRTTSGKPQRRECWERYVGRAEQA